MKKVLFATTALVLSAGVAAAEVSVSGNGRMGVVYNGYDWNFSSRARVVFTLSGQTDGGLEFGGEFRADQAGDSAANNGAAYGTEGSVYISGAFGKIEMGDVVSAPEALFGDLPEVGYTDLATVGGFDNDIPYLTLDNGEQSGLLYTYTAGAFSVAASLSDGKDANYDYVLNPTPAIGADIDQAFGVAAAYTFGNYTVGLGYEDLELAAGGKSTQVELAGVATFGNTSLKAYYAVGDDLNNVDNAYGLGVSSVFGATTVMGYVQKADPIATANLGGGVGESVTWYGLGASYDLGGGASITGGIADDDTPNSDPVADLGVKFKF